MTVKSVFLNDYGDYTAIDTDALSLFHVEFISRQDKYDAWYESVGSQASAACKNRTKELLCSDYFRFPEQRKLLVVQGVLVLAELTH